MRVLIIEDDAALAEGLAYHLKLAEYDVDICLDGACGLDFASRGAYDLILLDRMLPESDGVSLLRNLRGRRVTTPVLMITALSGVNDRVDGLDAGADDYLVKPFAMEEMLARVRALSRRPPQLSQPDRIQCGNVTLFADRGFLQGASASCSLSKREARLLAQFMRNPGQTLPRELLLARVWGPDAPVEDGNLDNYIYFLRKRLKSVDGDVKIATVHGLGYRLEGV